MNDEREEYMKKLKILIVTVGTICAAGSVLANVELPLEGASCSVNLITDACGADKISLEFRINKFILSDGDVHCWFTQFELIGKMKNPRMSSLSGATTVDLYAGQGSDEKLVGEFSYRQSKGFEPSLATLRLQGEEIRIRGGRPATYHLSCIDNLSPLSCEEKCLQEGRDIKIFPCHIQCGGW